MFQVEQLMDNMVRLFNPRSLDRVLLPPSKIDRVSESESAVTSSTQEDELVRAFTQSTASLHSCDMQYPQVIPVTGETHFTSSRQLRREALHYQLTNLHSRPTANQLDATGQLCSDNILASGYSVDQSLRPLQPDSREAQSMQLYRQHCVQLTKYILIDIECKLLRHRRDELNKMDRSNIPLYEKERAMIEEDCSSLDVYLTNLKKQVDHLKQKKRAQQALKDGWVFL